MFGKGSCGSLCWLPGPPSELWHQAVRHKSDHHLFGHGFACAGGHSASNVSQSVGALAVWITHRGNRSEVSDLKPSPKPLGQRDATRRGQLNDGSGWPGLTCKSLAAAIAPAVPKIFVFEAWQAVNRLLAKGSSAGTCGVSCLGVEYVT